MTTYVDPVAQASEYQQLLLSLLGTDDPAEVQLGTPAQIRRLFAEAGDSLRTRPEPEEWSVFECAAHIADAEIVYSGRYRWILAHHQPDLPGYDQDLWVDALHADGQTMPDELLSIFEPLRAANIALWRRTPPEQRSRYGMHSERGPESYELSFKLIAGHDRFHLDQARRTLQQVSHGSEPARCSWADSDPLLAAYHDDEWGRQVTDDIRLFEMLTLEGAQAGLSWLTILRKRDGYRQAFAGFDPRQVAAFDDSDRGRLLADAAIVRNRAKIDATIGNARAFLDVAHEFGSFNAYLSSVVPQPPVRLPPTATPGSLPATTLASDAFSGDLKRRGFKFVGSTIAYSFMQAVGLVDDHLPGCYLYRG